jgi:hypothetical protein
MREQFAHYALQNSRYLDPLHFCYKWPLLQYGLSDFGMPSRVPDWRLMGPIPEMKADEATIFPLFEPPLRVVQRLISDAATTAVFRCR